MKNLRRAFRYMAPYWGLQATALACALVVTASNFVWPFVSKLVLDKVLWPSGGTAAERQSTLYLVVGLGVGLTAVGSAFGLLRSYLFAKIGEQAAADLRRDLFRRLHWLPMRYYDQRKTGGIMSVVQNDVEAIQGLYSSTVVELITNVLTLVAAVVLMFMRNPSLAVVSLPVPLLFGVSLVIFGPKLRNAGRIVREETGHVQEVLQESIAGEREVKVFTRGASELTRYMERVAKLVKARVGMSVLGSIHGSTANLVATGGMMFVLAMGAQRAIGGEMTAGDAVLFMNVVGMLMGPASAFVSLFGAIATATGAADRIFEYMDEPLEDSRPGAARLASPQGSVRFTGVGFGYNPDAQGVLAGIDLDVPAGQAVALVGPSGSGKTTLVSLLPRLYDASEGRIELDGTDLRDLDLEDLRSHIAFVPQEPFLFGTTVRENIGFGRADATDDQVEAAARAANAHEFIIGLPDGYATVLGERGTRLSVGQKQRIAIARAVLRDPRVLILDEATSAQDSESERLVQEAMGRLMQGRTSFVIAHRLSTIQRADRIVVLEEGRIVEQGRHDDLLAGSGLYARLHALQFEGIGSAVGPSSQAAG